MDQGQAIESVDLTNESMCESEDAETLDYISLRDESSDEDVVIVEKATSSSSSNETTQIAKSKSKKSLTVKGKNKKKGGSAAVEIQCSICLVNIRAVKIASPSSCNHIFCVKCLERWSKTNSTCPLDRMEFDFIRVKNRKSGELLREIKVKNTTKKQDSHTIPRVNMSELEFFFIRPVTAVTRPESPPRPPRNVVDQPERRHPPVIDLENEVDTPVESGPVDLIGDIIRSQTELFNEVRGERISTINSNTNSRNERVRETNNSESLFERVRRAYEGTSRSSRQLGSQLDDVIARQRALRRISRNPFTEINPPISISQAYEGTSGSSRQSGSQLDDVIARQRAMRKIQRNPFTKTNSPIGSIIPDRANKLVRLTVDWSGSRVVTSDLRERPWLRLRR